MDNSPPPPKKKNISVNFCCALFYVSDLLNFEDGTNGLPQKSVKNYHCMLHNIQEEHRSHDDLVMRALVSFCMVWFRVIRFGAVQFGGSYMNLRRFHIHKGQILGKTASCIRINTVILKLWNTTCILIQFQQIKIS